MLIDTHMHLDDERYSGDQEGVLKRSFEAGVGPLITIGTNLKDSAWAVDFAFRHDEVYATVGLHPGFAPEYQEGDGRRFKDLALKDKVVAIGEVGLDYHEGGDREIQQGVFRRFIGLARELELPLAVHQRDASQDALRILKEEKGSEAGGVLHCFSGDWATAEAALDLGFYIAIGGVLTFPNARALREVIARVPLDRLVLETDAPWLAPQGRRGQRNEPAFLDEVAAKLAEVKGLAREEVERATTANALKVFRLQASPKEAFAYAFKGALYLNLTNRCSNACAFCDRRLGKEGNRLEGFDLSLKREPSPAEVSAQLKDLKPYREVVFCGYGEPTLRLETLAKLIREIKGRGGRTRLNTNGQGSLIHGRDIAPDLAEAGLDEVSISLNAPDAERYQRLCHSKYGAAAFEGVKDFIRAARKQLPKVVATAVALPGADLAACRKVAVEEMGVEFRERPFFGAD